MRGRGSVHPDRPLPADPAQAFLAHLISLYRGESHVPQLGGITSDHVQAALGRWKDTEMVRGKTAQLPSGEHLPLADLMGLVEQSLADVDLPAVSAEGVGDPSAERVSSSNAAVLKKVVHNMSTGASLTPGKLRAGGAAASLCDGTAHAESSSAREWEGASGPGGPGGGGACAASWVELQPAGSGNGEQRQRRGTGGGVSLQPAVVRT